ncbi:MAG: hypothetical protein J6A01_04555 [Proteobacteria bacterium]|nr:hypothetical protein [Pseudomonadota bacterium]
MIKCYKCGANQIDTNKKCVFCGADLTNQNAQPLKTADSQSSNDLFNDQQSNFGKSADQFPYYSASVRQSNQNAPLIIGTAIFIVAVAIIIFVILFVSKPKLENDISNLPNEIQTENITNTNNAPPAETKPLQEERTQIDIFNLKHDMILDEIRKNDNIIPLKKEDLRRNPEDILNDLITKLVDNKNCYDNSEDFVIQMDGDLNSFQNALKKIDYQKLYKALANKHTVGGVCKKTRSTASWLDSTITGTQVSPKSNKKERHSTRYSSNETFYTDNNLLDINLAFYYSIFEESDYRAMFVSLGWETGCVGHYRFFELDDTMDPYVMMAFAGRLTYADVQTSDHGSKILLQSKHKPHRPWLDSLMQADEFQLVYGRYVKNNEDGYYYVISYRKYSLTEMHERCPFVKDEYAKIPKEDGPNPNVAPDPRPKDSSVALPF